MEKKVKTSATSLNKKLSQQKIAAKKVSTPKKNVSKKKLELDQYDYHAHEEDEGDINKFQIYDTLSKQITDGSQMMPQAVFAENRKPSQNSDNISSGTQKLSNSESNNAEFDNEDENFFEQAKQKKRSFTDDQKKFAPKKSPFMDQIQVKDASSTNDNSSMHQRNSKTIGIQSRERSSYSASEGFSEEYMERREINQEEVKENLPKFENLNI